MREKSDYLLRRRANIRAFYAVVASLIVWFLAASAAEAANAVSVHCAGNRAFQVRYSPTDAIVRIEGKSYTLTRKSSSLGAKYASSSATLIIDGGFASLVARGLPRLQQCLVSRNLARSEQP